jgi:carboxypeptidase family protein
MPAFRIATPCSASWAEMQGNNKVRHCRQCELDVYNFSAMTSLEINQIVAARTGRLCARFYQRPDGTMLTENCPAGIRAGFLRGSTMAAALAALVTIPSAKARAVAPQSGLPSLQMQSPQQGLKLEVLDPSGAVLPGASVSLLNERTGQHFDLTTDFKGTLTLPDLPTGFYELAVTASGFSTFRENHLTVPGQAAVTLQLSALMGEVVAIEEPSASEISAALTESSTSLTEAPPKAPDHRNALQRFFLKLRRIL